MPEGYFYLYNEDGDVKHCNVTGRYEALMAEGWSVYPDCRDLKENDFRMMDGTVEPRVIDMDEIVGTVKPASKPAFTFSGKR